jgi:8-oxo-dGTP pyrophosphatase MutT (NUDIX family)
MGRTEYLNDPTAPKPNSLVPAAGVLAVDDQGRVLLQRRRDTGQWAIPMGKQELGETVAQCAVRETLEETGVTVEVGRPGRAGGLDIHPTQWRQLRDWLGGTYPHID